MERLKDKDFKEKLAYNILKRFAKKKGWIEYRYDDGFYMFGPNDEGTRKGVSGMVKAKGLQQIVVSF